MRARAFNSLGLALMNQERFQPALDAFEESLRLRQGTPDWMRRRAVVMNNIGLLYRRWDKLEQAQELLLSPLASKGSKVPSEIWKNIPSDWFPLPLYCATADEF